VDLEAHSVHSQKVSNEFCDLLGKRDQVKSIYSSPVYIDLLEPTTSLNYLTSNCIVGRKITPCFITANFYLEEKIDVLVIIKSAITLLGLSIWAPMQVNLICVISMRFVTYDNFCRITRASVDTCHTEYSLYSDLIGILF